MHKKKRVKYLFMFVPKENINLVNAYIIFPLALFTFPPPTPTRIFKYLKHTSALIYIYVLLQTGIILIHLIMPVWKGYQYIATINTVSSLSLYQFSKEDSTVSLYAEYRCIRVHFFCLLMVRILIWLKQYGVWSRFL